LAGVGRNHVIIKIKIKLRQIASLIIVAPTHNAVKEADQIRSQMTASLPNPSHSYIYEKKIARTCARGREKARDIRRLVRQKAKK
jgi:hypothetical protein